MCAPKVPTPPSPKEQGAAQTAGNVTTATANAALGNINEYTPQGSVIRKQTGTQNVWDANQNKYISVPTYSTYQTYSPGENTVYQSNVANRAGVNALAGSMIDNVGKTVSQGIDYSKMPAGGDASKINLPKYQTFGDGPNLQTTFGDAGAIQRSVPGADDFSKDRQKYEDALMGRMNPQLDQDRNTLEQQLLNQGLQPGSEAYNRAADQAGRARNDARYGAILNAGTEQQRMFNMALGAGNFANSAQQQAYNQLQGRAAFSNQGTQQMADNLFRQTGANNNLQTQGFNAQSSLFGLQNTDRQNAIQEAYQKYTLPINTISALMGHGAVQQPSYAGANMPQLPNVDYAGLMQNSYANAMSAYNASNANTNSLISGAGSLFSSILPTVLGASDVRLKENIVPIGEADGHNIYAFDYRDAADGVGRQVGVMAQEVMQTRPDAVLRRADGMLMVDYSKLFGGQN